MRLRARVPISWQHLSCQHLSTCLANTCPSPIVAQATKIFEKAPELAGEAEAAAETNRLAAAVKTSLPFLVLPLPFLVLPLPFLVLPLPFLVLLTAFPCFSTAFSLPRLEPCSHASRPLVLLVAVVSIHQPARRAPRAALPSWVAQLPP